MSLTCYECNVKIVRQECIILSKYDEDFVTYDVYNHKQNFFCYNCKHSELKLRVEAEIDFFKKCLSGEVHSNSKLNSRERESRFFYNVNMYGIQKILLEIDNQT